MIKAQTKHNMLKIMEQGIGQGMTQAQEHVKCAKMSKKT